MNHGGPPARRGLGWVTALVVPVVVTAALTTSSDAEQLPLAELLLLATAVLAALLGGLTAGLAGAVVSFLLLNWFFTPPVHGLSVARTQDVVALAVYVAVAAGVALVVDHAARRAAEATSARAAARAAALETAQATSTALLRAVSHDLRTPLATVRASVDGLLSPGVGETDRDELVSSVDQATDQLERLIDDLLDLSRLQTGLLRPVLADRSLEEVLPPAVSGHREGAVLLDVDEGLPLVRTDAGLLSRVVANLVANAVRFAGDQPVRVAAEVGPASIDVLVVDHGPGVPVQERERMWEPFQRLGDAGSGLGLGLAVARGLAESVGGSVAVRDTDGGGLTMVVTVPRA